MCDAMCVGVICVMCGGQGLRGTRAPGAFWRQQQLGRYGAQQLERESLQLKAGTRRR